MRTKIFRWSNLNFALYLMVGLAQSPVLVVQLKMDTGQQPIPPHLRLQEEAALYRRHECFPSAPVASTKHSMVSRWYQILAATCICMVQQTSSKLYIRFRYFTSIVLCSLRRRSSPSLTFCSASFRRSTTSSYFMAVVEHSLR